MAIIIMKYALHKERETFDVYIYVYVNGMKKKKITHSNMSVADIAVLFPHN